MLSWYDGLCLCLGDTQAYELLEWANEAEGLDLAAVHGLTRPELASLRAYTLGRGKDGIAPFGRINGCLRFPQQYAHTSVSLTPLIAQIISALTRLPAHRGIAYRYVSLPDDVLQSIRRGRFRDAGFLSASRKDDRFPGRDLLIIRSKSGRSVDMVSAYASELEVLFPPNTAFDVSSLEENAEGAIVILNEA